MSNNNHENQNARQFRNDWQIRYHWCADDSIMAIINSREKSHETTELVRKRTELARPGVMRPQWNRGLGREIYVSRYAVHYVQMNREVEQNATRNKQQEDNIRAAELDFLLDLETIIKETAADPDLLELNCCLEDNNSNQLPPSTKYRAVAKKLTHRWGIIMVGFRIIIPTYAIIRHYTLRRPKRPTFRTPRTPDSTRSVVMRPYSGGQTCGLILKRQKPAQLASTPVRI